MARLSREKAIIRNALVVWLRDDMRFWYKDICRITGLSAECVRIGYRQFHDELRSQPCGKCRINTYSPEGIQSGLRRFGRCQNTRGALNAAPVCMTDRWRMCAGARDWIEAAGKFPLLPKMREEIISMIPAPPVALEPGRRRVLVVDSRHRFSRLVWQTVYPLYSIGAERNDVRSRDQAVSA